MRIRSKNDAPRELDEVDVGLLAALAAVVGDDWWMPAHDDADAIRVRARLGVLVRRGLVAQRRELGTRARRCWRFALTAAGRRELAKRAVPT